MSKNSEAVKTWRKNTKLKIIQSMGGCCQICGYCKCPESMDMHHLDPTIKEFTFGKMMANPKAWTSKIIPELKKCILLCANCHREYHAGYVDIPETFCEFDSSFIDERLQRKMNDLCPVCDKGKPIINKHCSVECASQSYKRKTKIEWPNPLEFQKRLWEESSISLAKELGVSDKAVQAFCKRNNLTKPPRGYWTKMAPEVGSDPTTL